MWSSPALTAHRLSLSSPAGDTAQVLEPCLTGRGPINWNLIQMRWGICCCQDNWTHCRDIYRTWPWWVTLLGRIRFAAWGYSRNQLSLQRCKHLPWSTLECLSWTLVDCPAVPLSGEETVVYMLMSSKWDYCHALYIGLPLKLVRKVQQIQNAVSRLIQDTNRYEHISPVWHTFTDFLFPWSFQDGGHE